VARAGGYLAALGLILYTPMRHAALHLRLALPISSLPQGVVELPARRRLVPPSSSPHTSACSRRGTATTVDVAVVAAAAEPDLLAATNAVEQPVGAFMLRHRSASASIHIGQGTHAPVKCGGMGTVFISRANSSRQNMGGRPRSLRSLRAAQGSTEQAHQQERSPRACFTT
jgi:hypothetical protein